MATSKQKVVDLLEWEGRKKLSTVQSSSVDEPLFEESILKLQKKVDALSHQVAETQRNNVDYNTFLEVARAYSSQQRQRRTIRLSTLLERGAIILAFLFVLVLMSWFTTEIPLMNPFAAFLGLVGTPFMYWMGRAARRDD